MVLYLGTKNHLLSNAYVVITQRECEKCALQFFCSNDECDPIKPLNDLHAIEYHLLLAIVFSEKLVIKNSEKVLPALYLYTSSGWLVIATWLVEIINYEGLNVMSAWGHK